MTRAIRDVRAFIVSTLSEPLAAVGLDIDSVPDDIDLRAGGVIDSLGFIQLIGQIEARFGCSIDLSELPPEQLTNLDPLSRHIAAQVFSRAAAWTTSRAVNDRSESRISQRRLSPQ